MNNLSNESTVCLQLSEDDITSFETFRWWVDEVIERFVGSAGLVANLLAIIILTRRQMSSNFNLLLTFLAVCDSLFIVFGFLEGVESNLNSKINFDNCLNMIWYPVYHMAMTASIYMTICLSYERYRALIIKPSELNSKIGHQSRRKAFIWAFLVIGFAIAINVPKFWELKFTPDNHLRLSELYNDFYFVLIYDNITRNLVLVVIPFTSLVFLNLRIFLKLRKRLGFGNRQAASIGTTDICDAFWSCYHPCQLSHPKNFSEHAPSCHPWKSQHSAKVTLFDYLYRAISYAAKK